MQLPHLSHSRRWQRLGILRPFLIIVATLLFVLAASYRLSSQQAVMLAGAVVALWGVLLLWRWPQWGLVAYVLLTMSLGVTDSMGLGSYLNEAMLLVTGLAGLWLLDMVVREKSIRLVRTGPLLPLLALVVASLLAFANGQLLWFFFARPAPLPAQLAGLAMFLLSAAAFLLAAHRFTELRWLRYVTWVFLGFGALFLISRVAPGLGAQRFLAPGLHGGLFWVWVVALSLTQALFNHDLKPGWRAGAGYTGPGDAGPRLQPAPRLGIGLAAAADCGRCGRVAALLAPGVGPDRTSGWWTYCTGAGANRGPHRRRRV
jgi:hypothetical protein